MIDLATISTTAPKGVDKSDLKDKTKDLIDRLGELQYLLQASQKYSVLVILQGMDASGKDGAVRKVFEECHQSGVNAFSFKKPTEEEFAHDFLWRVHKRAPEKGMIHIFNRSHYEDVLIQRVHKWIDEETVDKRFKAINDFEQLLAEHNNTIFFKFYLHLSKDQQIEELQERIDEREKNWKHKDKDWEEREHWDEYRRCYNDAINRSTIPWHVVPVDNRWYRDYIIAKTMVEVLEKLDMDFPSLETERFK